MTLVVGTLMLADVKLSDFVVVVFCCCLCGLSLCVSCFSRAKRVDPKRNISAGHVYVLDGSKQLLSLNNGEGSLFEYVRCGAHIGCKIRRGKGHVGLWQYIEK